MHRTVQQEGIRSFGGLGPAAIVGTLIVFAIPGQLSAQIAQTAPPPEEGAMVVLREVPTRPAQATGTGDTLEVQMGPGDAFADALDLGLAEIDDAQAALITSSAVHGLGQLDLVEGGGLVADALIAETLERNGLSFLDASTGTSAGSIVSGSVDASLATANAVIDSALSTVNGAISNLNGGGQ